MRRSQLLQGLEVKMVGVLLSDQNRVIIGKLFKRDGGSSVPLGVEPPKKVNFGAYQPWVDQQLPTSYLQKQ